MKILPRDIYELGGKRKKEQAFIVRPSKLLKKKLPKKLRSSEGN